MRFLGGVVVGRTWDSGRRGEIGYGRLCYIPAFRKNGLLYSSLHVVLSRSWNEFSWLSWKDGPPEAILVVVDVDLAADVGENLIMILNVLAIEELSAEVVGSWARHRLLLLVLYLGMRVVQIDRNNLLRNWGLK